MPIIMHGVTVPPTDTASSPDSAIDDMLVEAVSEPPQDPTGSNRPSAQCAAYITEPSSNLGWAFSPCSVLS
jgi:hypothetical protein